MFKVTTKCQKKAKTKGAKNREEVATHEIKSLEIIWRLLPKFGPHNTLHVDDLRRNFALNHTAGIRVSSFKVENANSSEDRELPSLVKYLRQLLANDKCKDDFTKKNHAKWLEEIRKQGG